jgi:transposase InsO family protein
LGDVITYEGLAGEWMQLMATFKRCPAAGLRVHSDRGSQYASKLYQKTLNQHQFVCSMSRKGNCWDNAPAESFFHTLRKPSCATMNATPPERRLSNPFLSISRCFITEKDGTSPVAMSLR